MALKPGPILRDQEQPAQSTRELLAGSRYSEQDYLDRSRVKRAYGIQDRNAFSRGLEMGIGGMAEAWHGAGAIASALVGDDQGVQESAQKAKEYSDLSARVGQGLTTSVADVHDPGSALSFFGYAAGQMAPSLAAIVTGGGAGAVVAKTLGQTLLKKAAEKAAVTGGKTLAARGAAAGALGTGIGIEQGALGSQMLQEDFDSKMTPRERAFLSLAGGTVSGSLEALPALNILSRYGLGGQAATALKSTIRGEMGKQALQEGSTEAAQQLVQRTALAIADENRDILGEEGAQELLDSFAVGAIGGGIMGGGTRAVTKGAQKLSERAQRKTEEQPPTDGIQVEEGAPADFGIEEIEIGGVPEDRVDEMSLPPEQRFSRERQALMEEMDLPGFTQEEIDYEIFGAYADEGSPPIDLPTDGGLVGLRDAQTAVDRGTAEDLPQTRTLGGVSEPEGSFAPAVEGDERANYQYDKVTRDSRGEPIREIPFAENAKTGWEKLNKRLAELNKGQGRGEGETDRQPYQAIGYDELVKRQAQREHPGNRARQAEFIKEKAAVVSQTRQLASARIQEGQDPLEYLAKFKAIEGPPDVTQGGASVSGRVPGDLALTEEDLSTSVGEIRGDDGFPITDGRSLGKERTRRQILRPVNTSTLNQGLNEGSDIVLEPKTKDNKGKVLNAVSLTTKMRDRVNLQQTNDANTSLAAKAFRWFTAGINSLNEAGHTVDFASIPDTTVILKQGKKAITLAQAREAAGNTPQSGVSGKITNLERVGEYATGLKFPDVVAAAKKAHPTDVKAQRQYIRDNAKLTEAQAARINQDLQYTPAAETIAVAAGDTVASVRKAINSAVVAARREGVDYEFDPTQQDKTGIPGVDEAGDVQGKPMRPIKRDTPATGKKVAIGVAPETVLKAGGFAKIAQARNAAQGSLDKPVGRLRANAIARNASEATGQTFTPEQFVDKTGKEILAELKRFSSTGQRVVQKTQTGYAREITTDAEVDLIRKSTADMTPQEVINDANNNLKNLRIAKAALEKVNPHPTDGRLPPSTRMQKLLEDAGLIFKREDVFYNSETGSGTPRVKAELKARLNARIKAYEQTSKDAKTAEETRDAMLDERIKSEKRLAKMLTDKFGLSKARQMMRERDMGRADEMAEPPRIRRQAGFGELEEVVGPTTALQRQAGFGEKLPPAEKVPTADGTPKFLDRQGGYGMPPINGRADEMSDATGPDPTTLEADAYEAAKAYRKTYNANKKNIDKYQGFIDATWAKLGGAVDVHIMTPDDFDTYISDPKNHAWGSKVGRGVTKGTRIVQPGGREHWIFVNFDAVPKADEQFAVFAHEYGHSVEVEMMYTAKPGVRKALTEAYNTWFLETNGLTAEALAAMTAEERARIMEQGSDTTSYQDVINARLPLPMMHLIGGGAAVDGVTLGDLDPKYRKYFLSFEEWFADQTSRYFTSQPEANDLVGGFFKQVADAFKQIFGFAKKNGYTAHPTVAAYYNEVLGLEMESSAPTFTDAIMRTIKAVQPSLSDEQVQQISRIARAIFRRENKAQHSEEQIAREAIQIAMAANDSGSELGYAAMKAAYENFLNLQERQALHRAFSAHAMKNQVRRMLREDKNTQGARAVMADPDAAIAYGYQLWLQGRLQVGPKSDTMFQRMQTRAAKVLGIVADGANAEGVFRAMRDNEVLVRQELGNTNVSFATPQQTANSMVQRATAGMRQLGKTVAPIMESVFQSAYSRMQATKNGWLVQLAREMYVPPGSEGQRQGMLEAKSVKLAEFHNRVARILQGRDDAFKARVVKGMNNGKFSTNADVRQVQEELKSFMEDMRQYLVGAGVNLGDQSGAESGYWPWVFDTEVLSANGAEFKAALVRNMPDWFVEQQMIRQRGKATYKTKKDTSWEATDTKQSVADRVYASIMQSKGYADGGSIHDYDGLAHTPYMGSHDTRILAWMANEPEMSRFLSSDIDQTLIGYIDQSVRRAEFARRFNDDGSKIQTYLDNAERAGMTDKQRKLAQNYISAVMGTLGGDINPTLRKSMSYVMVYENLRLLSMSLFSSLVDPNGILVRSSSFADTMVATRAGIREIADWAKRRKGEAGSKSDIRILAETIGTIEDSIGKEALGYEYGGAYMAGPARNLNEKWFEVTGIAGYTRLTRIMATAAAQNFLKRHKQGLDKHSARYLDELGVDARDIQFDPEGNLRLLTPEERQSATAARIAADDRVRNAVFRFVDEAILRPDSAQRPVYGSDPHFMLVFHLKGFMYSFYERIMKRAYREAMNNGNLVPAMSLSLYVPGMIFADMLRDAVKDAFGDQDDDRRDDWTLGDWADHGIERSGLFGPYVQQLVDGKQDYAQYGKLPGMSMFGPAAEHAYELATMRGGLDNQLARALPGQNLVRPLADSFAESFE